MNKQELKAHILKIGNIDDIEELQKFAIKVSLSELNKLAKRFLFDAIEIRREELTMVSAIAECCELKIDEIQL